MSSAETFSIIVTAISPIILGILALFQVRRENRHNSFLEVQSENEKLRNEKETARREQEDERLRKMEASINEVTSTVKDLQSKIDGLNMEEQLNQLHTLTELNFSYIRTLSDTVIVIGDALASSESIHDDASKRLTDAIDKTREKEDQIAKDLLTILS